MPRLVTDLPEPDSPTMPRVRPRSSWNDTSSTLRTTPSSVGKWIFRFRTSRKDDDGLLLSGMGFSLADKTRRDAEDSVTQQAIKNWQARAQQAALGLGFPGWRPGHITVQTGDAGRAYPVMRAQAMASSAGSAPVAVEGGTTDVSVTVSGEAILAPMTVPTR